MYIGWEKPSVWQRETIKKITDKPLSGCLPPVFPGCTSTPDLFTSPRTTPRQRTIEDMPEAHAAEIHPVQMTKILRDIFSGPSTGPQIRQTPGQEGTGRLFCITGARDCTQSRKLHRHPVLETIFSRGCQRRQSARIEQLLEQHPY